MRSVPLTSWPLVAAMVLAALGLLTCSRGTPPPAPLSPLALNPEMSASPSITPSPTPAASAGAAPASPRQAGAFPVLGVEIEGEVIPIENGQRLTLSNGLSVEVFVVPFPPFSETDVHLFLLQGEKPATGARVVAIYDMTDMDHGAIDRQIGREVEEGHYAMLLDLFMYGDWAAEVIINHQDFNASLRVLLGVYPWRERKLAPQG